MAEVWARSLAEFIPAQFVGIGPWESIKARLEPGCSLADLLTALGLTPEYGDDVVTVGADGTLDSGDIDDEAIKPPTVAADDLSQEGVPEAKQRSPWGSRIDQGRTEPYALPAQSHMSEQEKLFSPWGSTRPHEGAFLRYEGTDWSRVVFLVSGRGGVGRSLLSIAIAERAASHLGRNAVLVDANVGQAGLATNLRAVKDGSPSALPTIADLRAGASVQHVVSGPDDMRRAGGVRVGFACVLAPDPDQATADACSPDRYRQVIDELAPVSDLIVVDTCVVWQSDPTSITSGLVSPGLRAGASVLVVTDPSLEGVAGAHRLVSWATRLAPGRVAGLLNKAPAFAAPSQVEASRLFSPAPCLGVIPYSESIAVAAVRGHPVGRLTGLAADKVLAHLGIA